MSGGKRCLPTSKLRLSNKPGLPINLSNAKNKVLTEKSLIVADFSGSEVNDIGHDN